MTRVRYQIAHAPYRKLLSALYVHFHEIDVRDAEGSRDVVQWSRWDLHARSVTAQYGVAHVLFEVGDHKVAYIGRCRDLEWDHVGETIEVTQPAQP